MLPVCVHRHGGVFGVYLVGLHDRKRLILGDSGAKLNKVAPSTGITDRASLGESSRADLCPSK